MESWQKVLGIVVGALVLLMTAFSFGFALGGRAGRQAGGTTLTTEGSQLIEDAYDKIRESAVSDPGEEALAKGAIDVGLLYSTDGTIAENGFVLLEDDMQLQSADNITPLVRSEILTPEIGRLHQLALAEGVAEQVMFTGRRSREFLKLYYSAADVFVTTRQQARD